MSQNRLQYFYARVWKDDNATYFPSGEVRALTCMHAKDGIYGVNIKGEIFSVPESTQFPQGITSPPTSPPTGSDWQTQQVLVPPSNVYGTESSPFATGASNYKLCVRIKDLKTQLVSYVDKAEYDVNIATCNPDTVSGICQASSVTINANITSADFQPLFPSGSVGLEYIVNQTAGSPSTAGTFVVAGTSQFSVSGLTGNTNYYIHYRTICADASQGAWVNTLFHTSN